MAKQTTPEAFQKKLEALTIVKENGERDYGAEVRLLQERIPELQRERRMSVVKSRTAFTEDSWRRRIASGEVRPDQVPQGMVHLLNE